MKLWGFGGILEIFTTAKFGISTPPDSKVTAAPKSLDIATFRERIAQFVSKSGLHFTHLPPIKVGWRRDRRLVFCQGVKLVCTTSAELEEVRRRREVGCRRQKVVICRNFREIWDFWSFWLQKHPSRTGKLGAGTRRPYDYRKTKRRRNTTIIRAPTFDCIFFFLIRRGKFGFFRYPSLNRSNFATRPIQELILAAFEPQTSCGPHFPKIFRRGASPDQKFCPAGPPEVQIAPQGQFWNLNVLEAAGLIRHGVIWLSNFGGGGGVIWTRNLRLRGGWTPPTARIILGPFPLSTLLTPVHVIEIGYLENGTIQMPPNLWENFDRRIDPFPHYSRPSTLWFGKNFYRRVDPFPHYSRPSTL